MIRTGLDASALLTRAGPEVARPRYDRDGLQVGIVHFGVGGFHRAHQALVMDRLLNQGLARDWAICGVGLLPEDRRMHEVLSGTGGLYTLVEKHPDGNWQVRVIGSIVDFRLAPEDPEAVLGRLADPAVRIVSLTITEGAYAIDPVTGRFDATHPSVVADERGGGGPSTAFGYLVEGLSRRRAAGIEPFTVMSCDNMRDNGCLTRRVLTGFARARDPELAEWIQAEVCCPNSMVDRITPATTKEDRSELERRFGVDDSWPVVAEPFLQWVLEDSFSAGRPPLDLGGVQLVSDVEPYELMKLRLLNASHQAMAYIGLLSGFHYVHEAAQDPVIRAFLRGYMRTEAVPTLPAVPGIDLEEYCQTLLDRFASPAVADTLARLAAKASDRIPNFLLPVILDNLAASGSVRISAAVVASWARYAEGVDEHGAPLAVDDRLADSLQAAARRQGEDPTAFLQNRQLFGGLADEPRFVRPYVDALQSLKAKGAHRTVAELIG